MDFSSWTKKNKGIKEDQNSAAAGAGSDVSFSDWTKKNRAINTVQDESWKEEAAQKWLSDVEALSNRLSSEFNSRKDTYQDVDTFGRYRDDTANSLQVLRNEGNIYRDYFNRNKERYDSSSFEELLKAFDDYGGYLDTARSNLDAEYDYWSQFENEDDYNLLRSAQKYASIPSSDDFVEKSAYASTANGKKKMNILATLLQGEGGSIVYDDPGYDDLLYEWINGNEEAGALIREEDAMTYGGSDALGRVISYATKGEQQARQMTDEEKGIFNYLYATEGKDAAYNYYYYMQNELNYRNRMAEMQQWQQYASENPFGASAFSVLERPFGALSYLNQIVDYIDDRNIDVNDPMNKFSYIPTAIRSQVSSDIEQNWGKAGSYGYNLGMSMADSMVNMLPTALTGGAAAGAGWIENLMLAVMGAEAAADTVISMKDQGYDDDKAFTLGTVAGLAEFATERIGMDAFLDTMTKKMPEATFKQLIGKELLKNIGAEGGEEGLSDVINWTADLIYAAISDNPSEFEEMINGYKQQGYGDNEAVGKAIADRAKEMGLDVLGGGISGGLFGAGGLAINYTGNVLMNNQNRFLDIEAQPQAPEAVEQPEVQTPEIVPQLATVDVAPIQDALVAAGADEKAAEEIAPIITDILNGEEISGNKAAKVAQSDAAVSVLESETGVEINTDAPISEVKDAIKGLASPADASNDVQSSNLSAAQEIAPEGVVEAAQERRASTLYPGEKNGLPFDIEVRTIPTETQQQTQQASTGKQSVAEFAETLGKAGQTVFNQMYNEEQNAVGYVDAMTKVYNFGKNNLIADSELSTVIQKIAGVNANPAQLQAAYMAGKADSGRTQTVENAAAPSYTKGESNGYDALVSKLAGYNRTEHDGFIYTIQESDGKYYTYIEDAANAGGYVSDARAVRYSGGPFETRADAARDLLGVARSSFYQENTVKENVNEYTGIERNVGKEQAVAEVPHGEGNAQPEANGSGNSGLLDELASEDVQPSESGRNESGRVLPEEGRGVSGYGSRSDAAGSSRRSGVGDRERGNLPASREVVEELAPAIEAETEADNKQTVEEETAEEIEDKDDLAVQEEPRGSNFIIPAKGLSLPSGEKARFKANINAIKTLRTIMAEGRLATPAEQDILSKYVGWGGIANAFDESKADWAKEYKQLKGLLTEEEYKAARGSTLNAHYTDVGVIRGMYAGLEKLGFTGGRLLEPSAGVGHFVGAMPENMLPGVKSWTMVELDNITGNIAKYLYPNADVRVQGFEEARIPDNYMDMAISNVPFGNYAIVDKTYPKEVTKAIHNYFFAKSLDKVRPGGLVAFITSRYTMDAQNSSVRQYIMQRADLLGAIRLPDSAFKSNAGTEVVTDILVLKKREPGTKYNGEAFENTDLYHRDLGIWDQTNEYFHNHPEMVLGEATKNGSMYRGDSLTYTAKDTKLSLQKQIEKAFGKIKGKMDYPVRQSAAEIREEIRKSDANGKEGSIVKKDGKLYKVHEGALTEAEIAAKDTARMEAVIGVRDAGRALLDAQISGKTEAEISALRKELNKAYDDFVKKNGPLNKPGNKRLIDNDSDAPFILALENYDKQTGKATKTAIFTRNTVAQTETVTHVDTVEEGLTVVMNEEGEVDIKRIAQLTGESEQAVTDHLLDSGLIFLDRDGNPVTAEIYLSGNVKAKLRDAEALAEGNPDYQRNVDALKKIIPADIAPEDISVRLGVTWVPDTIYSDFAAEMLGSSNRGYTKAVTVQYSKQLGEFSVTLGQSWLKTRPENLSTWGTPDKPFHKILEATLNNRSVSVWRKTEDGGRVLDKQATAAAQEKQEKVLAAFQEWIWADDSRKGDLAKLYNDVFNNTVTPHYDGSNLTVNGANVNMPLRAHQKDAVQRIINSGGNTLLAHRVGAGKTYEMAAAAMKLRQLGIVKKPMFVVPKSLVAQWGKEFLDYFPAAKVLVAGENSFASANRKQFINQIATGDYDAVILSYEQFKAVPMSKENQEAFYQQQIDELEEAIRMSASRNGRRDPSIKQLEKSKKTLETKLRKIGDMKKDADNTAFELLGVDSIFVDEAHNFKNLFYTTNMNNVSGLGNKNGTERAFDLYMKVRYLQKLNGGRGVVFATATPVMNSMSEMYIMQKYLQSDLLEAKGLTSFDAWANQFGEVRTVLEMNPSGKGYRQKQSFSRFKNLAELQQMFRSFADVLTDIPGLKIPTMKTGKRIIVESEPSDFQMDYIDKLAERADAIKGGRVDPKVDNMLKITSEGRKLSYTQRMLDPSLPYEDGNKIMKCVSNIYDLYNESKDIKGTQLVFCDLSTPKGGAVTESSTGEVDLTTPEAEDISIYDDMKNMLVAQGIPAKEIAFIHDADTQEKRKKLFEDVNEGKIRVLIGSTGKMGVGMNAQKRVVALHHLDAPWRPGDIEQREGRALRQGNINDEVDIYVYVTKKTFDSRMWDNLQRKASFIHQVMAGDLTARESEGDGDFALSAAEIKAISSGNPLIMEQFEVAADLAKLEALERAHNKEVADARSRLQKTQAQLIADEESVKRLKKDLAARKDTGGDKFSAVIGGETFTERKAAGEAIIEQAKKHLKMSAETEQLHKIGTFAGFDLLVNNKAEVILRGASQYRANVNMQSAVGTIQSLEAMPKRIDGMLANIENRISEGKASVKKLEQIMASTFDRAEELASTRRRNAEILAELNPVEDTAADMDDENDNEVSNLIDVEEKPTKIAAGMNDSERYELLKDRVLRITAKPDNGKLKRAESKLGSKAENAHELKIGERKRLFKKLGEEFDVFKSYENSDVELDFTFSHGNMDESTVKQNERYKDFAKLFTCFDDVIENAIGIEVHNRNNEGYKPDETLANVYVLMSAFEDGDRIVPVKLEIKEFSGKRDNTLHVAVALQSIKKGEIVNVTKAVNDGQANTSPSLNVKIADLFRKINPSDVDFLKYIPKQFFEAPVNYSRDGGITPHPEQWTADRIKDGKVEAPRPVSEIIAKIRHDLGINITYGHVRGKGVRGQFSPADKGVRSRIAQDLPTISHEIGHWLDDKFNLLGGRLPNGVGAELEKALGELKDQYPKKAQKPEGLAEFIRKYLQNRDTAAIDFPETTKYVLGSLDAKTLAEITQFADEINAYYSLDADTASSSIRLREEGSPDFRTPAEKIMDMGDSFNQAWVDSNHVIRQLDKETGGNAYIYATNAAYSDAIGARILEGDLTDPNGKYIAPGLKAALQGVNTRNKKEYKDFNEYLVVLHGPERLENGKRVFADDRKNNASFMNRRRADLEAQYPAFKEAARRVIQFEKDLVQTWGVNTGLISQERFDGWNELYENHVPLNRAIPKERGRFAGAKRGFANQSNPFRKAKGSGLDIIAPVDNIISEVVMLVNAGVRNNVMQQIANTAEKYGADASFMEKVPTPVVPHAFDMTGVKAGLSDRMLEGVAQGAISADSLAGVDAVIDSLNDVLYQYERGKAGGDVVTVLRDGTPEFWKINDKSLLESITHLSTPKVSGILEAYAKTTRFMTANITGNNPIWSIFSNAPRDLGTFAVYSKEKNPIKAVKAIGSTYINAFNQAYRDGKNLDPLFAEYLALGGGHASAYSADADLAKKARRAYTSTTARRVMDTVNPVNWISFISDTIEMGPRFATYKLMRLSGADPQTAFYEAMDVTVNFRKAGYQSRQVNKVVPFFNASVQGVDKFARYFSAEDAAKGERASTAAKRAGAFVATSAILAALLYALNNGDDEKKKEYQQLSNYTKNSFWCIPLKDGKYFCIPKPRELAVITSLFETSLELWEGGNEHAFDEFYEYAVDNFMPSVISDLMELPSNIAKDGVNEGVKETLSGAAGSMGILGVGFYIGANRDFLGKPIESTSLQNLEPRDRFTQSTSKMAYYIGQGLNMSPQMIDYFGNQVLGYVWKVPRALFPVGDNMRDYTLGVKNTYVKDNVYSQDLVNWLYDKADASNLAKNSDKENMDKAIAAKNDSSMTTFYSRFNSLNKGNETATSQRTARQTVLDMIYEYRKSEDAGSETRAQKLVYDVIRKAGETELMPSVMNTYIKNNEKRYDLSDSQYVEYQTTYNGYYWSLAEESLSGKHTDRENRALLRQAKELAKQKADEKMLKRIGVQFDSYTEKYSGISDSDIVTFKAGMDIANDDGSLKQEEVISILEIMIEEGLSYEDASALFRTKYDSDKNNPWKWY